MFRHLDPFPIRDDLRSGTPSRFRNDALAGITVALFAVPQAMAYALLAGVPPVYGLYAAVVMSAVAGLWGSSPYVNTGPTNSAALLTAAALLPLAEDPRMLGILATFTLLVGLLRLAMGAFRMGWLMDFVPEPAFLGFTLGAGTLIAFGPLHHLLGVDGSTHPWFPQRVMEILAQLPDANLWTLGIGLGSFAGMLLLSRFLPAWPNALVIILGSLGVTHLAGPEAQIRQVVDISRILGELPRLSLPVWDIALILQLMPAAVAVAVIGLIEAVSIGHTLALRNGQRLDADQEFFGQGLGQIVAAFLQGFPGSGSFSRSLLIERVGGQTRLAQLVFSLTTLAAVLFAPRLLEAIPLSALGGLLLFIGIQLLDLRRLRRVFASSRSDATVLALTFFTTVFINIALGIFAGILAAAMQVLARSRRLQITEILPSRNGGFEEVPYDTAHPTGTHPPSALVAVGLSGDLFYGVAPLLRDQLAEIVSTQSPRHLILRIRRAYSLDFTCWTALVDAAADVHRRGGTVYLCGVNRNIRDLIQRDPEPFSVHRDRIYPQGATVHAAFREALNAALDGIHHDPALGPAWQSYDHRTQ